MKNIFLALLTVNLSACSIINIFEDDGKYLKLHLEACGWKYKFVVKIYYLKK